MPDPVLTARDHLKAYAQVDGIQDIFFGVYFMLFGGSMVSQELMRQHSPMRLVLFALLVAAIGVLLLLRTRLIEAARRRYTYPRLGYVSLGFVSEEDRRRRIGVSVALLVVIGALPFVAFGFLDDHPMPRDLVRWVPAFTAFVLGGVCLAQGVHHAYLRRYVICGPLIVAVGITLSLINLPSSLASGWGFVGFGSILVGGGGLYAVATRPHDAP